MEFRQLGRKYSNWGRWGEDDRIGTLNHITAAHRIAAAALIKTGKLFNLSIPLSSDGIQSGIGGRNNPVHMMRTTSLDTDYFNEHYVGPPGILLSDDFIMMALQCSTQWDGLAHVGYDGKFYNGVPASSVTSFHGSTSLSIHQTIERGIAGRGVLLDIAALKNKLILDPGEAITADDLTAAEERQGVRVGAGDILLFRTGQIRHFTIDRSPEKYWNGQPGIDLSCVAWLHERSVAAIAADNGGVEATPPDPSKHVLPVHCVLIRDLGMTLGEIFDLEALAADCARDGVWEFFFSAPALNVANGVGSPITPLAFK